MNREHFLHFRNAYLNSSSTTTSNARFNFTSFFGKVSNFSSQHSKWIKVFSTGVIIYSSYYYFKRCSKSMNWNCRQLQLPFLSFCYRIKKLFSRPNIKHVENKKHAPEVKELSEHVKYDMGWFDELDELKKSLLPSLLPSSSLLPSLLPEFSPGVSLRETTPRGEIVMYYDAETKSFNYYSNSKNIPYSTLDVVARKYVCLHKDPSIYIDIRDELQQGREKVLKKNKGVKLKLERDCRDTKKSLFATFKNYKTGRNAPKSIHNYDGKVKFEEFEVAAAIKDNINKFIYKGTLEQYNVDAASFNKQDKRQPDVLKEGDEGGGGIVGNICEIVAPDNDSNYLKIKNEKECMSYADFKQSLILKK